MFNCNVKFIKGVGEKRAEILNGLGIDSVGSLLYYLPRAYEDWQNTTDINSAENASKVCVKAKITSPIKTYYIRKNMTIYKFEAEDENGTLLVTLYNNKYLAESLKQGQEYLFYGVIYGIGRLKEMSSPKIKLSSFQKITPIYPSSSKMGSSAIEKIINSALTTAEINEFLPNEVIEKHSLCSLEYALHNIHSPDSYRAIKIARRRLAFEEMFILQAVMAYSKLRVKKHSGIKISSNSLGDFINSLPFSLTSAQKRVIDECLSDFSSGTPMNRLVQGDVGSGKTAVAAALIHSCVNAGYQAALMVPTELLSEQHFNTMQKFLNGFGIKMCLLNGSTQKGEKAKIKEQIQSGEVNLVIGTHALIEDDVVFNNLGLVITDEQHRFGVNQRTALFKKGSSPHLLVMSATPIPRTLAMIIYGELDISIIDELPAGRQKIDTFAVDSSYRARIYNFIKKHLDDGRQGYIVCPLIETNEELENLTSATEYFEELSNGAFKNYSLGLLHGKMKPREKEEIMQQFSNGDIQLLISTTVIEVGIDVPNAVIMLIENAERFGLSQLHQLRGRIGRGCHKSTCILLSDAKGETARKRLGIMCQNHDGFKIADEDLALRGPGDFVGRRQHGLPELKIADIVNDIDLFKVAGKAARDIITANPTLEGYTELQRKIKALWRTL